MGVRVERNKQNIAFAFYTCASLAEDCQLTSLQPFLHCSHCLEHIAYSKLRRESTLPRLKCGKLSSKYILRIKHFKIRGWDLRVTRSWHWLAQWRLAVLGDNASRLSMRARARWRPTCQVTGHGIQLLHPVTPSLQLLDLGSLAQSHRQHSCHNLPWPLNRFTLPSRNIFLCTVVLYIVYHCIA